jgi:hypothetical protein
MRLCRLELEGAPRWGIIEGDRVTALTGPP